MKSIGRYEILRKLGSLLALLIEAEGKLMVVVLRRSEFFYQFGVLRVGLGKILSGRGKFCFEA